MRLTRRIFLALSTAVAAAPAAASKPTDIRRDPLEEYRLRVARLDAQGIKPIKTKLWRDLQR